MPASKIDQFCVNTIRTLSIDAVQKANSGHPGMPMGTADMGYVLWTKFLRHNPNNPGWFDRDRFILSAGHGSMLLYSLLHLTGYDVSLDELKNFRQFGSKTPGHPEFGHTTGVETTTGPLGQGFATGIGMAMAEAFLAAKFNKPDNNIVDHYTYAIVSDGDLMEGISHEAASLAGHLKLNKLIYMYDSNRISIDGSTDLAFTENVSNRFEAYNWQVQEIDGHDHDQIEAAIGNAHLETEKPSLIVCNTHIGYGSPNKQDSASSHGAPLGDEEVSLTKQNYGWETRETFFIPDEALNHFRSALQEGEKREEEWKQKFERYRQENPESAEEFTAYINRELPNDFENLFPFFDEDSKGMATRNASGEVLNTISKKLPNMIGGSADLTGSNKTDFKDEQIFSPDNYSGRNIHYGVREHAMAAASNGMALHGGVIPFTGTFFVFTDYMRPAIRLAALMGVSSIFVLTHDSIGLGEDGPTHQPVEHLASLRAMPNVTVLRPGDANEVSKAWEIAIRRTDGPTLLVLTRQAIPTFGRDSDNAASLVEKGGYIMADADKDLPDAILIGTGSELQLAMQARALLKDKGVDARVVSMPSWELFQEQDEAYMESVLPAKVKIRIAVEAGSSFGWERWLGDNGKFIGLDHFGASAPYQDIYEGFGITAEAVANAVLESLA